MRREREVTPIFADRCLTTAEDRRFRERFDAIGSEAKSQPKMIYQVRYNRADYHVATVKATREACRTVSDSEKRKAIILAGLAHLYEQEAALLADLAQEAGCEKQIIRLAQIADLKEDLAEKHYDIEPTPFTAADWMTESLHSIAAEKAKVAVLRPRALEAYAPRDPNRAA
jgi:uncharacterized sporulation protein YeaH/YhbH (DUF444 family)